MKYVSVVLACALALGSVSAEAAKRLGGGEVHGPAVLPGEQA